MKKNVNRRNFSDLDKFDKRQKKHAVSKQGWGHPDRQAQEDLYEIHRPEVAAGLINIIGRNPWIETARLASEFEQDILEAIIADCSNLAGPITKNRTGKFNKISYIN